MAAVGETARLVTWCFEVVSHVHVFAVLILGLFTTVNFPHNLYSNNYFVKNSSFGVNSSLFRVTFLINISETLLCNL